jgi:uncharacterized protein
VLILIAPNDRKYRMEVGYGLEEILPDGKVGGFGREAVPFFRQGDYSNAALLLTTRVAAVIAGDKKITLTTMSGAAPPSAEPESLPISGIVWVLIIAVFLFFPIAGIFLRLLFGGGIVSGRRGEPWGGGPGYGGGSWGGGGFGGGGAFGGFGGGSFGGGGASGSW